MTDHKAEAEMSLKRVANFTPNESKDWPLVNAVVAQAEAALYLAEQQRINNRIALAQAVADVERFYGEHGVRAGLVGHEVALYDNPSDANGRAVLHADIREGLGL